MKPSMPDRKINGVKLEPKEYDDYVKRAGIPTKQLLDGLINSEGWNKIPDFKKKEIINKEITKHRDIAKRIMISLNPKKFKIEPKMKKVNEQITDIQSIQ